MGIDDTSIISDFQKVVETWQNPCNISHWHPMSSSTQPSTLRGTVNEYQLSGWVIIINGNGGCRPYSSLQADSQPESDGLVWGSAAAWRCSIFIIWTEWTFAMTLWSWWQHYKYRPGYCYYYYYYYYVQIFRSSSPLIVGKAELQMVGLPVKVALQLRQLSCNHALI